MNYIFLQFDFVPPIYLYICNCHTSNTCIEAIIYCYPFVSPSSLPPHPPSSPTVLFTWVTEVILKPHWLHETSKLRQLNVCATVWIITAFTRERTRQTIYVYCNTEAVSRNHCCNAKAISITYFECMFIALVIRHAERMRRMISPSVAYPAVQYFPHYLTNGTIFWKKKLSILKCVFLFSVQCLSETFLIPRRIQRDIIITLHWSSCKVPVILVRF